MSPVGYEFLRQSLRLTAFPPEFPALVKPVTRIEPADTFLAIPRPVAPDTEDPVAHVLFALKHEGTNLHILAEVMPKIGPASLLAELRQSPTGGYIRTACYLWEEFTGQRLEDLPEIGGPLVDLFDTDAYITGPQRRDGRWGVAGVLKAST